MIWKLIEGYLYPYRVSDQGEVQKQLPNGKWQTIKPYPYNKQLRVEMRLPDGTRRREQVSRLVVDYHMGGTPPGKCRAHRNGMYTDNAVENIIFLTKLEVAQRSRPGNSKPVLKVDKKGRVVDIYRSQRDAARANHISKSAINERCMGTVRDPYRLDDHNYVSEDKRREK